MADAGGRIAGPEALARAEAALSLVGQDPRAALAAASEVVAAIPRPRSPDDVRAVVTAERAAGLSLRELSDPAQAQDRMRRAVRIAERSHDDVLAAQARMGLAYVLLELGRLREALRAVDAPSDSLSELDRARLLTIRALVLQRSGRSTEALAQYDEALAVLERHEDELWICRLRNNRAVLLAAQGDVSSALDDLEVVRATHVSHGRGTDAADALYNMGYIAGIAGDVVRSLQLFDTAAVEWGDLQRAEHAAGRAEVLLQAGLVMEALQDARASVDFLSSRRWSALEAEARLILAQTLLLADAGGADEARQQVRAARRLMRGGRRPDWAAIATYVDLTLDLRAGSSVTAARTHRVAGALATEGAVLHAADVRILHGSAALARGDSSTALAVLHDLASQRTGASVADAETWHARALLAEADGRSHDAEHALVRGWRAADARRSLLGATELRAGAGRRGRRIAEAGALRAMESGSVPRAFTWIERERGAALRYPPALPPDDDVASAVFSRARWAAAEDEGARLAGADDPRLAQARVRAEREVAAAARTLSGTGRPVQPASFSEVQRSLRDVAFVQLSVLDGSVHALVVTPERGRHLALGSVDELLPRVRGAVFALRRALTSAAGSQDRRIESAADRCRSMVLEPLLAVAPGRDLVVSPPGALAGIPWTLLAAGTGVAVTIAPSATLWARRPREQRPRWRVVAAAGPGLPAAENETRAVAAAYPDQVLLRGEAATSDRVLAEAAGCDVLHVAAHGTLRADNPLFSALLLADGPLTAYELERLAPAPSVVTMTACSAGAGSAAYGDDILGLAWALLAGGTHQVVAPLLPIPDAGAVEVATMLHAHLREGLSAGESLRRVVEEGAETHAGLVAAAFIAYG